MRDALMLATCLSIPAVPQQTDGYNHAVRSIDLVTGTVTTLAGNYALSNSVLEVDPVTLTSSYVTRTGPPANFGFSNGVGTAASFHFPDGITFDPSGTFALVVSEGRQRGRPCRPVCEVLLPRGSV